jgi:hypothetical protein
MIFYKQISTFWKDSTEPDYSHKSIWSIEMDVLQNRKSQYGCRLK